MHDPTTTSVDRNPDGLPKDGDSDTRKMAVASEIRSEITGKVWKVEAKPGDQLSEDDPIIILESMKMEIPIAAPTDGKVVEILVGEEDVVNEGDVVATFEP